MIKYFFLKNKASLEIYAKIFMTPSNIFRAKSFRLNLPVYRHLAAQVDTKARM